MDALSQHHRSVSVSLVFTNSLSSIEYISFCLLCLTYSPVFLRVIIQTYLCYFLSFFYQFVRSKKASDSLPNLTYPILSYPILLYSGLSNTKCRRRCCGTIQPYPFCADISPHPGIPYTLYSIPYTV